MRTKDMLAFFPTPFGAEDHENRGVNDKEQRFRPHREKKHALVSSAADEIKRSEQFK